MVTDTDSFTYLAAEVAKIEFAATTIAPNTDLRTIVKVTDTLGRDVTSEQSITFESSDASVVGTDGKSTSVVAGGSKSAIVVAKVGDLKTNPTTIKVANQTATDFVGFNIYKGVAGTNTVLDTDAYEKLDADKKVEYVYSDDTDKRLALFYKDQYGKPMNAVENGLKVTNVTPSVVIVENDGKITPISAGVGYVKVKASDNVEHTIKIVVREKAEIATMELEEKNVSVVKGQSETVKVTFKDQFGVKVNSIPTVKSAAIATATSVATSNSVKVTGVKEGTTTVEVSHKIGDTITKQTINVTVVEPGDLATYKAEVTDIKLDASNSVSSPDADKAPKSTDVIVNEIDTNGNIIGVAGNVTLKEVSKDGKDVASDKELLTINSQNIEAKAPGTAYVQVKVGSLVIDTLEFAVVKTTAYAKSVAFDRNDIVLESPEIGILTTPKVINDALLKTIAKAKDQYGVEMPTQDLKFTTNVTNIEGLTVDNKTVKELKEATGTADIVITKITTDTDLATNLIKDPVVVKLSVQATDGAIAKDALKELAKDYADLTFTGTNIDVDFVGTQGETVISDLVDEQNLSILKATNVDYIMIGTDKVEIKSKTVDEIKARLLVLLEPKLEDLGTASIKIGETTYTINLI